MKNTLVISAYTCCGKTYASKYIEDYRILDLNINDFKQTERLPNDEEIEKERKRWKSTLRLMSVESHLNKFKNELIRVNNPDFPDNFIQYIKKNIGKVDVIFVDSDIRIRRLLDETKIKFITIYPYNDCLQEWIGRMYLCGQHDLIIKNRINDWHYKMKEPLGDDIFRLSYGEYINEKIIEKCFTLGYGVNKKEEQ